MNSCTFLVSMATIADLDELTILFNEYRMFYNQESNLASAKAFLLERFEHRESVIFVAKDVNHNKIIGFTQLYPSFSSISMQRSLILNDLYVLSDFRGAGAARGLLEAAKDYAKSIKAKGLALSTAVDNVRAQGIYEKSGYERDEEFYHYFLKV
ncbi:GNAT family N-acetyltransferase [Paenibacillus protaetiae]|uniref:GNAT family N-acetyltransferase n=1 Tax=Paenibacillus protaetiae TaxID=2509456 RepID=A0A4P6ERE6_9BACL|nr:GNAT family N-acetyltransferase [Paenibacillus protaetiae]QAY65096.1 GNAT family N-acetyltransferase [Paenibacillus protaetiae]